MADGGLAGRGLPASSWTVRAPRPARQGAAVAYGDAVQGRAEVARDGWSDGSELVAAARGAAEKRAGRRGRHHGAHHGIGSGGGRPEEVCRRAA
jgi:hypothetical protein